METKSQPPTEKDQYAIYQKAVDEYLLSDKAFANMRLVKEVQAKWDAKGIHRDDPVYLLVEMLGLFEARDRQQTARLVQVIQATGELLHIATEEVARTVTRTQDSTTQLITVSKQLEALDKQNKSLIEVNQRFLDGLPKVHEQIYLATQTLHEHGILGKVINVGVVALAFTLGFLICRIFFR